MKYEFKPVDSNFSIVIKEGSGYYGYYDMIPYDIDNLKLTEKASGDVLIEAGTAEVIGSETTTGFYSTNAKAVLETETEYIRLENSDSFKYTGEETIEKGIYKLSLDVRLNTFDGNKIDWEKPATAKMRANNNSVSVALKLDGEAVETYDGALAATVNNGTKTLDNSWKTIEFILPLAEKINISDLIFELSEAVELDFKNLRWESAAHLYADDYIAIDGEYISKVDLAENEYISISGLSVAGDGAVYTDQDKTIVGGNTYTLTFDVRAIKSPDWENTVVANGFSTRIRGQLNGGSSSKSVKVTDEWTTVSTTVTAKNDGGLVLKLIEDGVWDFLPYDIDNISLICDETSEDMIEHGLTVDNGAGFGWSPNLAVARGGAPEMDNDLKVRVLTETDHYRIPTNTSGNNGFVYCGADDYLAKGIWHITGDFRLPEFRRDKLDMDTFNLWKCDFVYIISDNNIANLNAYFDGEALLTTDSEAGGIKITSDWQNAGFLLVVDSVSGIKKERYRIQAQRRNLV